MPAPSTATSTVRSRSSGARAERVASLNQSEPTTAQRLTRFARGPHRGITPGMRAMFVLYLCLIAVGILFYSVIGLIHN